MTEAQAANHAKTAFLRNISHEIRTPLSAMITLAQLLGTPGLSEPRRGEIQKRMLANGRALMALIDDLLDVSKVEAGMLDFEPAPTALLETVEDAVRALEPEAHRKDLELSVEPVGSLPLAIVVDPGRFRQILTNVFGNAIKFTERGSIRVRLERAGDDAVAIDVIDTGIGISPSQSEALFAPFQQADASIARRFGGTGLGLALSKHLAQRMGGDVLLVESRPGLGSTFRISLPIGVAPAPSGTEVGAEPELAAVLDGVQILVVDDNDDLRWTLAELLTVGGASVVAASEGEEAVELALANRFDVILMDVRMPILDGLSATRRLRQAGCSSPILALTADVVAEQIAECMAAGCNGFVPKPTDFTRVVDAIARVRSPRDGSF
ncbi:MAG TPA: ATP-binding protein, partial [Polyangiaceae bacterium]|nr:ATP-binding protein [Polyangiaceae bacterium]